MISLGKGRCPALLAALEHELGAKAPAAHDGLATMVSLLPLESHRRLTLGGSCFSGVTWDEAAILALLEATQRAHADGISIWMERLGVREPHPFCSAGLRKLQRPS
ncbi:MAG: hypothetical protein GC196_14870 [Hyphomonas sp.]|nr:hypothetical protein [Hyphomonas sp.]